MPGFTPLVVAARRGREADVAQLLADGADVNARAGGSSESGTSDWTAKTYLKVPAAIEIAVYNATTA